MKSLDHTADTKQNLIFIILCVIILKHGSLFCNGSQTNILKLPSMVPHAFSSGIWKANAEAGESSLSSEQSSSTEF